MRRLLVLFLLVAACAAPATAIATEPPRIENLEVQGGEANWHASSAFRLDWTQVPGPPYGPRAVIYRLFDSAGHLVRGPVRNTEVVHTIEPLEVPPVPDTYTAEVWLEDADGRTGPAARASLRFDDTPPPPPAPQGPEGWLAGHEIAVLGSRPSDRAAAALRHPWLRPIPRQRRRQLPLRSSGLVQPRRDRPAAGDRR
jgi:hypothetical protein